MPQSVPPVPVSLHLDRTKHLQITWPLADGKPGPVTTYTLSYLRAKCPCASCKKFREEQDQARSERKSLLTLLPGNYAGEIRALKAELVGNYALRIEWSDAHASGIYSFEYLESIKPA